MKKYSCDRCERGQIREYAHVDKGVCWKCNGTGKLKYDPKPKGYTTTEDTSYMEFMESQREMEEIRREQHITWMAVNNMFENEEENYYHG